MEEHIQRILKQEDMQIESQIICTALKIGLFDVLEEKSLSANKIIEKLHLKCQKRNIYDFLDQLYVRGILKREGVLDDAVYSLVNDIFLKSNKNNLIDYTLEYYLLPRDLSNLTDIIQNGMPEDHDPFPLLENSTSTNNMGSFYNCMSTIQMNSFKIASKLIDFSKDKTYTDVGGCIGALSYQIKSRHNHLNVNNFDLPNVKEYFDNYMKKNNFEEQVNFIPGNFFLDDFPKSDVISLGNILHDWSHLKKEFLFKKVNESLNEDGKLIIIEDIIDDERNIPSKALNMSTIMNASLGLGFNMSYADIANYAINAGFSKAERISETIVVCFK